MFKKIAVSLLFMLASSPLFAGEYWIDVRVPAQYEQQHIDGAFNVPLAELKEKIGEVVKNKDDVVHLYCNTGRQTQFASKILKGMGYTNIIDEGGIDNILNK